MNFQFGGNLIYEAEDEWGYIYVVDTETHRILSFDTVIQQSCMDLKHPEIITLDYLKAVVLIFAFTSPKSMMILGVGGGDLMRALVHVMPNLKVNAVELRAEILAVSERFFLLPMQGNITYYADDGRRYLENAADNSTDVIFSDMFSVSGVNAYQNKAQFLSHCHRALSDDGWLVANFHELHRLDTLFFERLKTLFSAVFLCPVPGGNFILFAGKKPIDKTLPEYKPEVEALSLKLGTELTPLFERTITLSEYELM